jgi:hypothetical protein
VPGCGAAKAGGGKRRQIQLPIPWHFDNAKKLGATVCKIYAGFSSGTEPELAANKITIHLQANQMPELLTPRRQIQNWAGRVNQAGRLANKGAVKAAKAFCSPSLFLDHDCSISNRWFFPGEASTKQVLIQDPGLMDLTECELEGISGGGWFRDLTGIGTPKFLKKLDDKVNELPGGWFGLIATIYSGGAVGGVGGAVGAGLTHMH